MTISKNHPNDNGRLYASVSDRSMDTSIGISPDVQLDNFSQTIKKTAMQPNRSIPPLEEWHPQNCGEMDLVIKSNGEWWHEGHPIKRQPLIDLFSSVLWKESEDGADTYYLKTPVEKIRITVEDVPFLITDVNLVDKEGETLIEFISSTGDVVYLDENHPLQLRQYKGEDRPYVPIRFGMWGLIARHVFMHLTQIGELTEQDGRTVLTLQSGGKTHTVSVANE